MTVLPMDATNVLDMDTPASRLKQRITVSYGEFREVEKSWMAARALVRLYSSVLLLSTAAAQ